MGTFKMGSPYYFYRQWILLEKGDVLTGDIVKGDFSDYKKFWDTLSIALDEDTRRKAQAYSQDFTGDFVGINVYKVNGKPVNSLPNNPPEIIVVPMKYIDQNIFDKLTENPLLTLGIAGAAVAGIWYLTK